MRWDGPDLSYETDRTGGFCPANHKAGMISEIAGSIQRWGRNYLIWLVGFAGSRVMRASLRVVCRAASQRVWLAGHAVRRDGLGNRGGMTGTRTTQKRR